MLDEILEDRCVQLVSDFLAMAFRDDEPGVSEDGEVPGDRRPARIELSGDVARRERAVTKESKDAPTRFVRKRAKSAIRRVHSSPPRVCIISTLANY
jgi:hypothetical protein